MNQDRKTEAALRDVYRRLGGAVDSADARALATALADTDQASLRALEGELQAAGIASFLRARQNMPVAAQVDLDDEPIEFSAEELRQGPGYLATLMQQAHVPETEWIDDGGPAIGEVIDVDVAPSSGEHAVVTVRIDVPSGEVDAWRSARQVRMFESGAG